ncbi:hypothetical protein ABG768_008276 [Culter alburnus]|uniref:Uncharacterized protein n=1 Tax=Culter alburnus TaxID=194366 RepID=A0AAW1ZHL1_CULAL
MVHVGTGLEPHYTTQAEHLQNFKPANHFLPITINEATVRDYQVNRANLQTHVQQISWRAIMVWREKRGRTGVRDTSLYRKREGAKQTGFRLQTTEPSGIPPLRCDSSTCRFSLTTGTMGQTRLHGTVITACRMCFTEHFKVVSTTGYEMCTVSRAFVRWNTCG